MCTENSYFHPDKILNIPQFPNNPLHHSPVLVTIPQKLTLFVCGPKIAFMLNKSL